MGSAGEPTPNGGLELVDKAVRRLQAAWHRGQPDLATLWGECDRGGHVSVLAALVKADLVQRYARGENPAAAEYLERFPALRGEADRVLSIVYEEYCLRVEHGERPDTQEFCGRYAPWKDSLESQLKYHRVISKAIGPKPPPTRFPLEGERFERFTIGTVLGRGGAARVYLARDESLGGREVVLKVSPDRGNEPSILGRLEHPHIVTVHAVATQSETGLRGLCMPYRPGLPIDEVIRRVAPETLRPRAARVLWDALVPPPSQAGAAGAERVGGRGWDGFPVRGSYADGVAWVIATLAEALAYAHEREIYHRDVKPANVLLTYREGPQLLDFNLSHDPHSVEQVEAALQGGTLPYMAPEQLRAFLDPAGWSAVLAPADIYSLGLLAVELLTGRTPDVPDQTLPVERAISALLDRRVDLRPGLRQADPRTPHALEVIIETCLAFRPENRYPDAASLAEDLHRFLARRPLKHAPNRSRQELAANWAFRHRRHLAAAALVAAVAVPSGRTASRWAFPPETRPAFLAAVADLDAGREPREALRDLGRLSGEDRASPVVGFYEAAALERSGRVLDSFAAFQRSVATANGDEALAGWARGRRGFATHALNLGAAFIYDRSLRSEARAAAIRLAERLFNLALLAEPANVEARLALAAIDENRNDFPSAHHRLTELIDEHGPGTPANPADRTRLRNQLQSRARNSCRWGQTDLGSGAPPAVARFRAAIDDLDRADRLVDSGDDPVRFDLDFIRCETLLALGDAAHLRGESDATHRFDRQVEEVLRRMDHHLPGQDETYRILAPRARERIREHERPRTELATSTPAPR